MTLASPSVSVRERGGLALPVFLLLLWGQLFFALLPTWLDLPSYRYALLAAPLWGFFMVRAWLKTVDEPSPPPLGKFGALILCALLVLMLPLVLIRALQQVDQFWRLPLWGHAAIVFSATALSMVWAFGWKGARHFLRVSLFAFVLLPWPSAYEGLLSGNLTRWVVDAIAALLPLLGYPIDQLGNAFVVRGNILDVSEGCSGLRSFQASLMIGLYLGEIYHHSVSRRLFLVGGALVFAMLGNGARIFYLTHVAYYEGPGAEARVHEAAGVTAVTFIYGLIGLLAWGLSLQGRSRTRRTMVGRGGA